MSDSLTDAEKDLKVFCDAVGSDCFARVYNQLHTDLIKEDPAQAAALELLGTHLQLMRNVLLDGWVPSDGGGDVQN